MPPKGVLGILAGGGDLPARIIQTCRETGRDFFVLAFEDQAAPGTVAGTPHAWVRLGAAGTAIDHLRRAGVEELVMAGAIRRPSLSALKPDLRAAGMLARMGAAALRDDGGDDGLLKALIGQLEGEGFRVVGAETIMPGLLASAGPYGAHAPSRQAAADIERGIIAARDLGARDLGQGAVVDRGRVLAVEAADGTDAMLARVAGERAGEAGGVLVKVRKPGQEARADLPAIGPATVAAAAKAGLDGIAVEAGGALVVDREAVVRAADAAGLFVVGVAVPEDAVGVSAATEGPLVFLVAGEPSGDELGARLMAAIEQRRRVRFAGVGGPLMEARGLSSLFPMAELSVMGLAEVVPHLPKLIRRLSQTAAAVRQCRPAVLLTIDSPGFNFRLAKRLKGAGVPIVHYVAPSVWAWRPGRARAVAGYLDHLMALLPFEPPYFEAEGLATTFVGHPVLEDGLDGIVERGDGEGFRRRHRIPPGATVLCVLPGSRRSETGRLLPVFARTLGLLKEQFADLYAVVPTVDTVADEVTAAAAGWPVPAVVIAAASEKAAAFAAADVALAASGTVALELAVAGVPAVIAYRVHPLTGWLGPPVGAGTLRQPGQRHPRTPGDARTPAK